MDAPADPDLALNLLLDGKVARPSACNALETLLVHADLAAEFLPRAAAMLRERGVELRGDEAPTERFDHALRSAVVMVNASSLFSDGGELGLGAEIGISTARLHAYEPMGAESLTIERFVVRGMGQTRNLRN